MGGGHIRRKPAGDGAKQYGPGTFSEGGFAEDEGGVPFGEAPP